MNYFTGNSRALGGNPDPVLLGLPLAPLPYEAGWKDTVIMHPGEKSRIAVRIDRRISYLLIQTFTGLMYPTN